MKAATVRTAVSLAWAAVMVAATTWISHAYPTRKYPAICATRIAGWCVDPRTSLKKEGRKLGKYCHVRGRVRGRTEVPFRSIYV